MEGIYPWTFYLAGHLDKDIFRRNLRGFSGLTALGMVTPAADRQQKD
jgi:hypothetical protein